MHCHRILVSALFADMSSLLTCFISKKYFYFHLFPLSKLELHSLSISKEKLGECQEGPPPLYNHRKLHINQ